MYGSQKMKNKPAGLKQELKYCKHMVEIAHPSAHWSIRIKEIEQQLKTLKGRKKNGKS
jgi:hypothetical protein